MVTTRRPWMTPSEAGGVVVEPLEETDGAEEEEEESGLVAGSSSNFRIEDPLRFTEKQSKTLIQYLLLLLLLSRDTRSSDGADDLDSSLESSDGTARLPWIPLVNQ